MTVDEVKELLFSYSIAKSWIPVKKRIWNQTIADYDEYIAACDYSQLKTCGGQKLSVQEKMLERKNKAEEDYLDACRKLCEIEGRIMYAVRGLDETEQRLVTERFINGVEMGVLYEKYYYTMDSLKDKFCKIYKKIAKTN